MEIGEAEKKNSLFIPLYNVTNNSILYEGNPSFDVKESTAERYGSSVRNTLKTGLIISELVKKTKQMKYRKFDMMIGIFDKLGNMENDVLCHDVDKNCQTVRAFECDRCRFGWYEVVGSGCKQGGSKYCGTNNCGGRNRPACPRGQLLNQQIGLSSCQSGSFAGFCMSGLNTECIDGKLICL